MIARVKEAVTTHINRGVGLNIATAGTVIPENTNGEGGEKDIDSKWKGRVVLGQTKIEVGYNQLERGALLVVEDVRGVSEEIWVV